MWYNKADRVWFEARREVLTAGDIISLLPVTKTGRKRTISRETYYKVMADKLISVHDDDLVSYGAAARGHCLEPYAIEQFNSIYPTPMYHWDHSVVCNDQLVGFSPDALDVREYGRGLCLNKTMEPHTILEIKSYDAVHHMTSFAMTKEDLPERWQVAVGMHVCPTIETGYVGFYNPRMQVKSLQFFTFVYKREDLTKEFEMINEVIKNWFEFRQSVNFVIDRDLPDKEVEIEQYLDEQRLIDSYENLEEKITESTD